MKKILVGDAETYYADDYTLSKLTTESYVRDPRFECHGFALKFGPDLPAKWFSRDEIPAVFEEVDWENTAFVGHHLQFDGLILSHHYKKKPKFFIDTLSMARLLLGNHLSVGLDALAKHFGLAAKIVPYNLFRGKHWNELTPAVQQMVGAGACHDVELTWQLFNILAKDFPRQEYEVVDTVIKMFTNPVLRADVDVLANLWESEATKKQQRLAELNVTEADLQSAERFAQLLRDCGVEPEMKQGKNEQIYAFAKTDDFMRDLQEHDDERVQALAEARLGVKSTLLQTRAETLGFMAGRGPLCVYLRYAGAGTLRVSGGDGTNWLNFKRRSPIRKSVLAPEEYLLAPIDSSQIECRVLHYLAGGPDEPVIQKFRRGEDPYVDIATEFYHEPIYKPKDGDPRKDEMEAKRGMGKQGRLMCGYGAAGPKFKATAKAGLYGPPVDISLEDASKFVSLYRELNPSICAKHTGYWAQASRMLSALGGSDVTKEWGPLSIRDKRIYLPEGQPLIYDTLEYFTPPPEERHLYKEFERDGFWRLKTRHGWKTMWGSKLVQNVCEAVSRVIVSQAMIRITRMGYRVLNWPYDELLVLIPKDGREVEHAERCKAEMLKAPPWLPGLPLDAEYSLAERYSK